MKIIDEVNFSLFIYNFFQNRKRLFSFKLVWRMVMCLFGARYSLHYSVFLCLQLSMYCSVLSNYYPSTDHHHRKKASCSMNFNVTAKQRQTPCISTALFVFHMLLLSLLILSKFLILCLEQKLNYRKLELRVDVFSFHS